MFRNGSAALFLLLVLRSKGIQGRRTGHSKLQDSAAAFLTWNAKN
jgi:hypothetical protein